MANSMTGFSRSVTDLTAARLTMEIKTVNHRYLEMTLRLPDRLRFVESLLREQLRQGLSRGKVELMVRWQETGGATGSTTGIRLNRHNLRALQEALQEVRQSVPEATAPDALSVLSWPGVLAEPEQDETQLAQAAQSCLRDALRQLQDNRRREGDAMVAQIAQRLDEVSLIVSHLRASVPELQTHIQQRLQARLDALNAGSMVDQDRLAQEVALLAQKADVAEELDRLDAHVAETRGVLARNEPIGRRLDFLMQEFNREANTLASKAAQSAYTQAAIDLKVQIEQMREQIQNLE